VPDAGKPEFERTLRNRIFRQANVARVHAERANEMCINNDATACLGLARSWGSCPCAATLCAENEYGLSYGGVGPLPPPSSPFLPACKLGLPTPAAPRFLLLSLR